MRCPSCGFDNMEGVDRCDECMEPFRQLDVPQPKEGFQAHLMLDPVRKLYSSYPAAVSPGDPISRAIGLMCEWRVGCVPVLESGKLVGILTEVDVLFKPTDLRDPVSKLMTPSPEVVEEDSTIACALNLMSVGGYRHLPVVRDKSLVGILSIKDVLRYLKENLL